MSETVIQVRDLGKRYSIGGTTRLDQTIPEAISERFHSAVQRLRHPRAWVHAASQRQDFWALRGVNFDVRQGDVVGIIGRNGAGKSTLLKILSQITDPTEGYAVVHGRVASLLEVGTGFHPELTGRENIYLNGSILGMTRREIKTKFDEIVDFSGVEKFLDTPIKRYSSGMTMRLAFSVAAHLEPEILVIDEVLAVGDVAFQKKSLGKMDQVASEGRTVLFVSHNMSAVSRLCSRGILLADGCVESTGDIDDVIHHYYQQINQGSQSCCVDLTGHITEYSDHDLEVLSIELVNHVADHFATAWDQPIRLKIRVRVNAPLKNVSFGVGCRTLDHMSVFTVHSGDQDAYKMHLDKKGEHEISVAIHHNLNAGLYSLLLGVSSGQRIYYYNESAAQLEILGIGEQEYHGKRSGLIHCKSEWSV